MADCANCNVIDGLGESANYLRQMLPSIPLAVLKQKYSEAMIELCERGLVWRYVFEKICVYPDAHEYKLNKELDQDVVEVIGVYLPSCDVCGGASVGGECGCSDPDEACYECDTYEHELPKRADIQKRHGFDQGWYEPEPGLLVFNECFKKQQCLRVNVALKPEFEGTSFPPDLLRKWKKTIEYQTLALSHLMPGQKWSDNERFSHFNGLFENAIASYLQEQKELKDMQMFDLDACRPEFSQDDRFRTAGCRQC